MKGILIVEMPHCMCRQCLLLERMELNYTVQYWCGAKQLTIENPNEIQDFCPLKPLPPKRIDVLDDDTWQAGWNDCLYEITGKNDNE